MKKKKVFIVVAILIVGVLVFAYFGGKNIAPDEPGTTTLTQGTQTRYEDMSIGLSNVENDTAWLSVRDNVTNESTPRQVRAGETIELYGYQIVVSSVKKTLNLSILPGSSQGYVKFVVNKK